MLTNFKNPLGLRHMRLKTLAPPEQSRSAGEAAVGTRFLHGAPCPCPLISQRPWSCGRAAPSHPRPPSPVLKGPPHHDSVPRGPPGPHPVLRVLPALTPSRGVLQ